MSSGTAATGDRHDEDVLLSPSDLARWLGIPVATIYRWRYTGDAPPALRIGRHIRFRVGDVRRWLRAHESTSSGR